MPDGLRLLGHNVCNVVHTSCYGMRSGIQLLVQRRVREPEGGYLQGRRGLREQHLLVNQGRQEEDLLRNRLHREALWKHEPVQRRRFELRHPCWGNLRHGVLFCRRPVFGRGGDMRWARSLFAGNDPMLFQVLVRAGSLRHILYTSGNRVRSWI